jgi:hypothetical protein
MKKHLLIALVLLMTLPGMAQVATVRSKKVAAHHGNTTLTVIMPRNLSYRFWLYVDDVLQNEQAVRSICLNNLGEDSYYVRVELDNELQNCVGQFVDIRQSQVYAIVRNDKLFGLESSSANIRPELTMDLKTSQTEPSVIPPAPPTPPVPPTPSTPYAMNPKDYQAAYDMIEDESFDSSKLSLAKQVIAVNPMSSSQILGICKLFSFESNKLEFAKYAYEFCVDRNKYFLLNDAFTYESSKRELNEYIKNF